MEQMRMVLAVVLSAIVFIGWYALFGEQNHNVIKKTEKVADIKQENIKEFNSNTVKKENFLKYDEKKHSPEYRKPRIITINTPLYSVDISERGAVFKSFSLKKYNKTLAKDSGFKELISSEINAGVLTTKLANDLIPEMDSAVYLADTSKKSVNLLNNSGKILFSYSTSYGIIINKTYIFSPDTYKIDLQINIINNSKQPLGGTLITSIRNKVPEVNSYGFTGPCALIKNKLLQVDISDIEENSDLAGPVEWLSFTDRYFMTSLIPDNSNQAKVKLLQKENNIVESSLIIENGTILPDTKKEYNLSIFFGPKNIKVLKSVGNNLDRAINFGMFDFLAKPCLWLMNIIYDVIPNYGIAIIILTIFFKIILWPLGNKSYKSMNEMKKMQPLLTEIKEKYKNDKKKINEATINLYKTYKVNPVSGCLPMVAQIPIFFAFYRMLYEAIELRHAPFFGWIIDLSAPDRLFNFSFEIPFMEPPYGIPVLTIIMGATMFIQQKLTPVAGGDPAQAKIMMLMPIVFTFIFINFSSGLVLYWLINNVLSIAQQYYITQKN